jgi:hypothetical protein
MIMQYLLSTTRTRAADPDKDVRKEPVVGDRAPPRCRTNERASVQLDVAAELQQRPAAAQCSVVL